jgi:hypothetical protein
MTAEMELLTSRDVAVENRLLVAFLGYGVVGITKGKMDDALNT